LSTTGVLVPLTGPVGRTTGSPGVVPFAPGELHASGRTGPVLQDRGLVERSAVAWSLNDAGALHANSLPLACPAALRAS